MTVFVPLLHTVPKSTGNVVFVFANGSYAFIPSVHILSTLYTKNIHLSAVCIGFFLVHLVDYPRELEMLLGYKPVDLKRLMALTASLLRESSRGKLTVCHSQQYIRTVLFSSCPTV